jgi:hypothetical protein
MIAAAPRHPKIVFLIVSLPLLEFVNIQGGRLQTTSNQDGTLQGWGISPLLSVFIGTLLATFVVICE